jgi:adenylate cyclase
MAVTLSPKAQRNLQKILPFGIIWMLLGWVFLFIEHAVVEQNPDVPSTAIQLNLQIVLFASISVFALGLFIGTVEVFFTDRLFKKQTLFRKILYKLLLFAFLFFLIGLIFFPIAASIEMDLGLFDPRIWNRYVDYLTSITNLSVNIQMAVSLGISLFYFEMSEYIGQGALIHFFTGKYHRPVEEERIFMFLDMRSSTTIAEELGHIRYFNLLQDYYADLADPIILYGGELYQYVGDEMIISWKPTTGLRKNNCIRCFFEMKKLLEKRSEQYLNKYGLVPTFKAGIHLGKITTGEIGVLQKEIFFTGDILNATARIQGLCNSYNVDVLISGELKGRLQPDQEYQFKSMGTTELRGKKEQIELFSLS